MPLSAVLIYAYPAPFCATKSYPTLLSFGQRVGMLKQGIESCLNLLLPM